MYVRHVLVIPKRENVPHAVQMLGALYDVNIQSYIQNPNIAVRQSNVCSYSTSTRLAKKPSLIVPLLLLKKMAPKGYNKKALIIGVCIA